MKKFDYTIKDELGIHARPAGNFSKLAKTFESEVTVMKDTKISNATKLLALMSMGIKQNDTITVCVSGPDEEEASKKLKEYLEENL